MVKVDGRKLFRLGNSYDVFLPCPYYLFCGYSYNCFSSKFITGPEVGLTWIKGSLKLKRKLFDFGWLTGAVPPGARFDPFTPFGQGGVGPGRGRGRGRGFGPDPDHDPPPGWDDMFMWRYVTRIDRLWYYMLLYLEVIIWSSLTRSKGSLIKSQNEISWLGI